MDIKPMNHLEQILAEWLEYKGYFVRRNVKVGKRKKGGYEGELDVVAWHPTEKKLVHYEPSSDTHSWQRRKARFKKKLKAGRTYIPDLFAGLPVQPEPEQFVVFLYGSAKNNSKLDGAKVVMVEDLLKQIVDELKGKKISKSIVPEQFPLLRTLQLVCEYRLRLFEE